MGVKRVAGKSASAESVEAAERPKKKTVEGRNSHDESGTNSDTVDRRQKKAAEHTAADETDPNKPVAFSPATDGVHPPPYAADINMQKGIFYPEWAYKRKVSSTLTPTPTPTLPHTLGLLRRRGRFCTRPASGGEMTVTN